jgi:hypothetical protein
MHWVVATPRAKGSAIAGRVLVRGVDEFECPRQDSNLRFRLRRPALYPLSYGGSAGRQAAAARIVATRATSWGSTHSP